MCQRVVQLGSDTYLEQDGQVGDAIPQGRIYDYAVSFYVIFSTVLKKTSVSQYVIVK